MPRSAESWTTQQLAEFLALVSSFEEEKPALRSGVERAAEALDAEVAAVVEGGEVLASIGFAADDVPSDLLVAAAGSQAGGLYLPGLGRCEVIAASVGEGDAGTLLVARAGREAYSQEEADLLRGMGRVLALALRSVDLLASLKERQVLFERLTKLQRSIASRVALEEVFESIVSGAQELLGDETVGLRLVSPTDPDLVELVAVRGVSAEDMEAMRHSRAGIGAGGRAISEGRMIVVDEYEAAPSMFPEMVSAGIAAAMAAPVFQRGEVVGSLVVATHKRGRTYSDSEREALQAFAEHAGLALNDAKAAQETQHQAFHDALTGLPNRALFLDRLRHARERSKRGGDSVAVLFCDLDGFKLVNDSLGHAAGDQLLILVGQRIKATLGPADTVARIGGDEFAILLEEVDDPITAARAAQRAISALKQPIEVAGRAMAITASVGIAIGRDKPEDLLRNADIAMYEAKGRGKGRYEVFQREMHRAMTERLEIEHQLSHAVDGDQLVLHYQPIVDLDSGVVTGLEALVRWMHPDRGLIPPSDFIPIAEEGGQIHAIGRWVLNEACARAAEWQREFGALDMSVNVSSAQLHQASLLREVVAALSDPALSPGTLTLEITETVMMDATLDNLEHLTSLKELGVKLAVDDFGTGYSSLQYLRRLPVDWLKIAKPFVDGVATSDEERGLTRAIVDMADSLRLGVVAEGIESRLQADRLLQLRAGRGQGFYFSPPLPAEEVGQLLSGRLPQSRPVRA